MLLCQQSLGYLEATQYKNVSIVHKWHYAMHCKQVVEKLQHPSLAPESFLFSISVLWSGFSEGGQQLYQQRWESHAAFMVLRGFHPIQDKFQNFECYSGHLPLSFQNLVFKRFFLLLFQKIANLQKIPLLALFYLIMVSPQTLYKQEQLEGPAQAAGTVFFCRE